MNETKLPLGQVAEEFSQNALQAIEICEGKTNLRQSLRSSIRTVRWSFATDEAFETHVPYDYTGRTDKPNFLAVKAKKDGIHIWLGNKPVEKQFVIKNNEGSTQVIECGLNNPGIEDEVQDLLAKDLNNLAQAIISFLAEKNNSL